MQNPTNPAQISVVDWLLEPKKIQIADYQRPYSWNENLIVSFADSILQAVCRKPKVESPDIGLIVMEDTPDGEVIADGQQRILTFALLLIEALRNADKNPYIPGNCPGSRFNWLVKEPVENLATLQNAIAARRYIRNVLAQHVKFMKAPKHARKTMLRSITMAPLVLSNPDGTNADPLIIQLFRDFNTVGKRLNGGQILKAEHLGKVVPRRLRKNNIGKLKEKFCKTTDIQAQYEEWRRCRQRNDCLDLDGFQLLCLNNSEPITLDLFIDSPGDQCLQMLGHGFFQAVQAILLKQSAWWREIADQNADRLKPFERLIGSKDPALDANDVLPEFFWDAADPLLVERGDGFFQTVNRMARLYDDYCQRLLDFIHPPEKPNETPDPCSPGALVCGAAEKLASVFQLLEKNYRRKLKDNPAWDKFSLDDKKNTFDRALSDPAAWLAVDGLRRAGSSLPGDYGCLPTALFAVALCWCDHFGKQRLLPRHDIKRHFKEISPETAEIIQQVLVLILLRTKFQKRFQSVLKRLKLNEAVSAAEFSRDPESALWHFCKMSGGPEDSQREWLEGLEQILLELAENQIDDDADQNAIDPTVLNVISALLSR